MLARCTLVGWMIVIAVPAAPAAAMTLDEVEKDIGEKWTGIETLTADMTMRLNLTAPTPIESTGTFEYLRANDVEKKRMGMSFGFENADQSGALTQTVIYDGEFAWTIRRHLDKELVAKDRPTAMEGTPGGRQTLEQLRTTHTLKLLPDETVDGAPAYVIEAVANEPGERGISKYQLYVSKDTGVLFRAIGFDADGKRVTEITYKNIKINPKLDPAQFVFTGDENTRILDRTKKQDK